MKGLIRTFIFFLGSLLYYSKNSKIIYYHDFHSDKKYTPMSTSMKLFQKHLSVLRKNGFEIVPNITKRKGQVCVMLDDGWHGVWDNRKFFLDHKIFPIIFIAKSLVGQNGYLSEEEIRALNCMGFNFQSHTVSHDDLRSKTLEELDYELNESKCYIEQLLGKSVTEICAPRGRYSNVIAENAYRIGYNKFYSSTPGDYFEKLTDFSFVYTRNLCQSLTPLQFKLVLRGGYKLFQKIYFNRRYIKL